MKIEEQFKEKMESLTSKHIHKKSLTQFDSLRRQLIISVGPSVIALHCTLFMSWPQICQITATYIPVILNFIYCCKCAYFVLHTTQKKYRQYQKCLALLKMNNINSEVTMQTLQENRLQIPNFQWQAEPRWCRQCLHCQCQH